MNRERPDDVDELFNRLEPVEPPAGLVRAVFERTTRAPAASPSFRPALAWALLDLVALSVLTGLSVSLGWALSDSGGIYLLQAVAENLEVLADARAELAMAVLEAVPWLHLAALAVDLVVVYVLSRTLVARWFGPDGAGSGRESGR